MKISKLELFEIWKGRISDKKSQMDTLDSKKGFKRFKQYYLGEYAAALDLKIPVIVVNEVFSYTKTAIAAYFSRNPKIKVLPRRTQDLLPAQIAEVAINYYWYNKKIKRQIKKCIKESILCGYSWIKTGYEAVIEKFEGIEDETNEFIKEEDIYAIYVPYNRVWYDNDAQDPPFDCRWMIHRYLKPTEVLRKKYNDKSIQPSSTINTNTTDLRDSDRERTWLYEIWDKDSDKIFYYIEGLMDFVDEKEWPEGIIGFPFSMLNFDDLIDLDEGDNIPNSEIRAFEPQILEKIKLRSLQMEHLKRYNRQIACDKNKVSEQEKQKVLKGEIAAVIEIEGDPSTAFAPIPYPQIQTDVYQVENRIDIDRDKISGQSSLEQGAPISTKTRTLGEIEQITQGSQGRSAEKQDIIEEFTEIIATKLLQLMRIYLDKEQFARITGNIDASVYDLLNKRGLVEGLSVKYDKNTLQGMYDVTIVAGSTLPLNPGNRMNNLLSIAKFGQAFGLTPGSFATMQLGKDVMQEMEMKEMIAAYELDIQRILQPKEPSPQEQMKLMQMQQSLQKGSKQLEVMDNRMASNSQSTLKKAMDNARNMEGQKEKMDTQGKTLDLLKKRKDLLTPKGQGSK